MGQGDPRRSYQAGMTSARSAGTAYAFRAGKFLQLQCVPMRRKGARDAPASTYSLTRAGSRRVSADRHCLSLVVDQIPEPHPALAVKPHQLQLLDRPIVGRTGVDFDSRQQHRELEVAQVRRLAHDILAREIAARLFEHLYQGGRIVVAVGESPPAYILTR